MSGFLLGVVVAVHTARVSQVEHNASHLMRTALVDEERFAHSIRQVVAVRPYIA